jgi:hypothetical protein
MCPQNAHLQTNLMTARTMLTCSHVNMRRFPLEILPLCFFYTATVFCSQALMPYCLTSDPPLCVTDTRAWPMWVWWAASSLRSIPRMLRLQRYWRGLETNLNVRLGALQLLKGAFMIFMACHWVGCGYFFLARINFRDEQTWLASVEPQFPLYDRFQSAVPTQYVLCLFRGINAMTTIGLFMTFPNHVEEIVFTICVVGVQLWLNATTIGALIFYFGRKDLVTETQKRRIEALHAYFESKMLPLDLREKVYNHVEFQHRKKVENKAALSMELPKSLAVKVADCKYKALLEKCMARGQLFSGCNNQFINDLLIRLHVVYLMLGEEIAKKQDASRELVFVLHGAAEVMEGERLKKVIHSDVPDIAPVVSPEAFFFGLPQPNTIRARLEGEVQLLIIGREV